MPINRHIRLATAILAAALIAASAPLFAQQAASQGADPWSGATPAARSAIEKANALMKAGQWKSAYAALDSYDARNADAYALALKTEICLQGFVRTQDHRAFSLADLRAGQKLADLRSDENDYQVFEFDPAAAAAILEAAGAVLPAVLLASLGDYYYEAQNLFSDQWILAEEETCALGIERYEAAAAGGVANAEQLMRRGELLIRFSRVEESEAVIRQSLALDPASPDGHFALALALAQSDKMAEAYSEIDTAVVSYKDAERRFNALIYGARIAAESDPRRSESYLVSAEAAFPNEPTPAIVRQLVAVQLGKADAAMAAADKALDLFPDSPYVVRTLLTNWIQVEDLGSAMGFLDRSIARFAGKDPSIGILGFYKALLMVQALGPTAFVEAKAVLDAAEASFKKVYAADNQAFEAIAQLRAQLAIAPVVDEAQGAASQAQGAASQAVPKP